MSDFKILGTVLLLALILGGQADARPGMPLQIIFMDAIRRAKNTTSTSSSVSRRVHIAAVLATVFLFVAAGRALAQASAQSSAFASGWTSSSVAQAVAQVSTKMNSSHLQILIRLMQMSSRTKKEHRCLKTCCWCRLVPHSRAAMQSLRQQRQLTVRPSSPCHCLCTARAPDILRQN